MEQWQLTGNLWADLTRSLCRLHLIGLWSGLVHRTMRSGKHKPKTLFRHDVKMLWCVCVWWVETMAGGLLIYPAWEILTAGCPNFYYHTLIKELVCYIWRVVHISPGYLHPRRGSNQECHRSWSDGGIAFVLHLPVYWDVWGLPGLAVRCPLSSVDSVIH